jgi:hypothetical protein
MTSSLDQTGVKKRKKKKHVPKKKQEGGGIVSKPPKKICGNCGKLFVGWGSSHLKRCLETTAQSANKTTASTSWLKVLEARKIKAEGRNGDSTAKPDGDGK